MATQHQIDLANARVTLPPPRELTPAEKRANWWYYNKRMVIVGVIVAAIFLDLLINALGIGKVKPDYSVAYVGTVTLTDETVEALTAAFESITQDMNGDGKIHVEIRQYIAAYTGDSDSLIYQQAAEAQTIADVTDCVSYFFLLEDPQSFQELTRAMRNLDGTLPADNDFDAEGKYYLWKDCPGLIEIEKMLSENPAVEKDFSEVAFARRGFWSEKTTPNAEGCDLLWDQITGQ